jgi:hypothetical protein
MGTTRVHGAVTSVSWIPLEAVTGPTKAAFETGFGHYDPPPPDVLGDLEAMRDADAFRFANRLSAWAEFDEDGTVVSHEVSGGVVMGSSTIRIAKIGATFQAVSLPDLRGPAESGPGWIRFTQTCGGRTAVPMPRPVKHPPFVKFQAPIVWTTLTLTLHADGRTAYDLIGASAFPRHWVYDHERKLSLKAGLADYHNWMAHSFGRRTPWSDHDSPVITTGAGSTLERELSAQIIKDGKKLDVRMFEAGEVIAEQGAPGDELYLVMNGVLGVSKDGNQIAEIGPGAVVGERAFLEAGRRTSTLTAQTEVKLIATSAEALDLDALRQLSEVHELQTHTA